MTSNSFKHTVTFTLDTRATFLQHVQENPNNRRVSRSEKETIIEWLTNPHRRPSSQEEFSRRNYVRKTFAWDPENQTLQAVAKEGEGKNRTVITTDMIADVVETVHEDSGDQGHAGWDTTWKEVSTSYYGILRSDVIFLVKQCQICAENPRKRPKGSAATTLQLQQVENEYADYLNIGDVQYNNSVLEVLESDRYGGESSHERSARSRERSADLTSGTGMS